MYWLLCAERPRDRWNAFVARIFLRVSYPLPYPVCSSKEGHSHMKLADKNVPNIVMKVMLHLHFGYCRIYTRFVNYLFTALV